MAQLAEVFGIGTNPTLSYVDRGGLDAKFLRALGAQRHVAVHGGSKQGKSWLRRKGLLDSAAIVIQCTPSATPSSVIAEVMGRLDIPATVRVTETQELSGSLQIDIEAEAGWKFLAKAKGGAGASGEMSRAKEVETQPIGKTPADLSWVTEIILASGKRLVLEDFHYLAEEAQKDFAFLLKAMGEFGLYVIVVGVWPRDHLLTYYNGDLEGRVEDIHLAWSDHDLRAVVDRGAETLRVAFSEELTSAIVAEASGNVGLLQRLAEQVCVIEGVFATRRPLDPPRTIPCGPSLDEARVVVASQMQGRFETFADNFVRGMRRLPEGLEVYKHLLEAVTQAGDDELVAGLDSATLLQRISHAGIRASDLTQALERVDRLQVKDRCETVGSHL